MNSSTVSKNWVNKKEFNKAQNNGWACQKCWILKNNKSGDYNFKPNLKFMNSES